MIFYCIIFLFGLATGSFLNVVICRLGTGETMIKSRSHCPHCRAILQWYDLMPLLSFILLRGRCRYCRGKISWQYPIVEIATASLFLLIFNFKFSILNQFLNFSILNFVNLVYLFFIISCFIVIFVYDSRHYLILDKIVYPAIIIAFLYSLFIIPDSLFNYLLSALGASAFFLAVVLITKGKGMGLGDVKLAFLMGLVLGWPNILSALLMAFFSGAVVGIGLIIAGKKTLKSEIPFGPFLAGAAILLIVFNHYLMDWLRIFLAVDKFFTL